jgi:hypothetical protein
MRGPPRVAIMGGARTRATNTGRENAPCLPDHGWSETL